MEFPQKIKNGAAFDSVISLFGIYPKSPETPIQTDQKGHQNQINKQVLARLWRKGNPSTLLVGMQVGAATVENSMELPQKIKNGAAFDPMIPLLGIYPKNPETPIQKNLYTPIS